MTLRTVDPGGEGLRTVSADEFKDLVNKNDLGSEFQVRSEAKLRLTRAVHHLALRANGETAAC